MAKRKQEGRQRGTIAPLGPLKWLVRVYIGTEMVAGKTKRKYTSAVVNGSRNAAQQKLTEILSELDKDVFVKPSNLTLDAFMDLWFAAKSDLTVRTMATYKDRYRLDVKPVFGQMKLSDLASATPHFQKHYNGLVKAPRKLSSSTVQYSNMVLKQAFEDAIEWQYLSRNPLKRISIPRSTANSGRKQKNMAVLTPLQVENFLTWSYENDTPANHALWTTLFTSGIRTQEAFALTWDDLVFDSKTSRAFLSITKAVSGDNKGRWWIGDTKTFQSRRKISIPVEAHTALKRHRAAQLAHIMASGDSYQRDMQLIFPNSQGGISDISKVRKVFHRSLKVSKTPTIRLYDTRHTHATGLLIAGVHPKVVSERLGHKSIKITLDNYSHVIPEMNEGTADVVSNTFYSNAKKEMG